MVAAPRIVSLLPGATEMVAALGGLSQLVGVSHECDEPTVVRSLPRVTTTPINGGESSAAIDAAVRRVVAEGRQAIAIDADVLRALRPDVIVTQALCDVCAVADGTAVRLAQVMDPSPRVVTLQGRTLDEVWDDVAMLSDAIGCPERGSEVVRSLRAEVATLAAQCHRLGRPRVVAIEWLDPLFLAGHWVPDMIAAAGGVDVGAVSGAHSTVRAWDEVIALQPDLVLVILCGFDEARGQVELDAMPEGPARRWLNDQRVAVLDGNAFTSRPGPRLIEGIRRMAAAMRTMESER